MADEEEPPRESPLPGSVSMPPPLPPARVSSATRLDAEPQDTQSQYSVPVTYIRVNDNVENSASIEMETVGSLRSQPQLHIGGPEKADSLGPKIVEKRKRREISSLFLMAVGSAAL